MSPCAASRPMPFTSVLKVSSPANCWPAFLRPNSTACLTASTKSPPPRASATTFAPDAWACSTCDEKSEVLMGTSTLPTTLPPEASTRAVVSRCTEWPKA